MFYQFHFDIQKESGSDILLEAGYLGNISHHLSANDLTLNQVPTQLFGPGNSQLLRPFPQYSNVTSLNPNIGNSTYHGVFLKGERRFANGFSFLAHYMFSKFIDDVAANEEFGDPGSYMDQYNRRLDKGLSGSDIPQRAVMAVLYQVREFGDRHALNALAGGWRLGVETVLQSGAVFTVFDSANATNGFRAGTQRPTLIADPVLQNGSTLTRYFNICAFQHPLNFNSEMLQGAYCEVPRVVLSISAPPRVFPSPRSCARRCAARFSIG